MNIAENTVRRARRNLGFTLLEVMISLMVFGLLITFVFQFMQHEITQYNTAINQNNLEQKTRVALMHILDKLHVAQYERYDPGKNGYDQGIYYYDPDDSQYNALIDINPNANALEALRNNDFASSYVINAIDNGGLCPSQNTLIYFDKPKQKLIYVEVSQRKSYLIADQVQELIIEPVAPEPKLQTNHFVKIDIRLGDGENQYELFTMVRLY